MKRILTLVLVLSFSLSLFSLIYAQEEAEVGTVFTMTFLNIPRENMDEFRGLWEKDIYSLEKQIEEILSIKYYVHWWGPEWNVLIMTEYKTLADMEIADKKYDELYEKKYPDKIERDKIRDQRRIYWNNHFDAIVRNIPKLSK
jgi:hypothetical protein